ncbi:MAG: PD-(D/E)XK nuclease family protein [bacterium]|nr:PD-(D/E)XK nuclease family protein [bacterium]
MTKSEILQSIELRQSTIKDYLNCPLMFRFKHIDKINPEHRHPAALHGSTLHKLIYMIHDGNWDMDVAEYYREIFEEFEFNEDSDVPVKWNEREKELAAFEVNAVEILEGYRRLKDNHDAQVLYSEQQFRVKIGGYHFTGTIDQVRKNSDDTIELIDFKSGKQRPALTSVQQDWQLNLYAYALEYGEFLVADKWIKPKLHPDYCSIYFLRAHELRKRTTSNGSKGDEKGDPFIRICKSEDELKAFRKQMRNLLKSMLKDWHYPNPNHCNICSFTTHCRERNDNLSPELASEALKQLEEIKMT